VESYKKAKELIDGAEKFEDTLRQMFLEKEINNAYAVALAHAYRDVTRARESLQDLLAFW